MAFNMNSTFTGLRTLIVGLPSAGSYLASGKLELPTIQMGDVADSQVVVTIVRNPSGDNTTLFTGPVGAKGFSVNLGGLAANDILAITLSSSAAVDQPPGVIKATISVG